MSDEKRPPQSCNVFQVRELWKAGKLRRDQEGGCWSTFDPENPLCYGFTLDHQGNPVEVEGRCPDSDWCERDKLEAADQVIKSITGKHQPLPLPESPAPQKPSKPEMKIPEGFNWLDSEVLKLSRTIGKFPGVSRIFYAAQMQKMFAVIEPSTEETITLVLYNCKLEELDDPKKMVWTGYERHKEGPMMFVRRDQQKDALQIIRQVHRIIESKLAVFNKEKYDAIEARRKSLRKSGNDSGRAPRRDSQSSAVGAEDPRDE